MSTVAVLRIILRHITACFTEVIAYLDNSPAVEPARISNTGIFGGPNTPSSSTSSAGGFFSNAPQKTSAGLFDNSRSNNHCIHCARDQLPGHSVCEFHLRNKR